MSVKLHIERLVVEGIDVGPRGGARFQAAVEAELTRLVKEGGLAPARGSAVPHMPVATIRRDSNPMRLGAEVARVVYDRLKR